jgi:nickel-type superoxide dismutase maturation protease
MVTLRRVNGTSMWPALKPAQIVVVARHRTPRVGDVVVIIHGGMEKVKRLTAYKGGTIFVEGDNQAASTDSRDFGWLDKNVIRGIVVWPRKIQKKGTVSYQKSF